MTCAQAEKLMQDKHFLVVEDNTVNQLVIKSILRKWKGVSFDFANHGLEALEAMKTKAYDVVLMDLQMPEMDGYEATSIIKNDDRFSTIPLIIISALSDIEAITKGLKIGANEYLTKPYDVIEFGLRVKNAIKLGAYQNMINDHKNV